MCVHVHVYVCVFVFLYHAPPYFLIQILSLNLKVTDRLD